MEDNVRAGGFGAGVVEVLSAAGVDTPTTILGIPDEFLRFGDQAKILTELGLDEDGIVASVRKALG